MDKDPFAHRSSRSKSSRSSTPYARPEARADTSSGTSDRRKSFLGKVTDSVKELLTPSWLSSFVAASSPLKWPNDAENKLNTPPPAANVETSSPVVTDEHQSIYDANTYSSSSAAFMQQQPSARGQVTSASQVVQSQYVRNEDAALPAAHMMQSVSASSTASHHLGNHFQPPSSTQSGLGQPELVNGHHVESRERDSSIARRSSRASRLSTFLEDGRRPVVEQADNDTANESMSNRSSNSFNISSFAKSFSEHVDSSILNGSLSNSSFYSGRTVYGGMSSKRTMRLPNAVPYRRVTSANKKASDSSVVEKEAPPPATSRAAKLILKALDETGNEQSGADKRSTMFNPAIYLRKRGNTVNRPVTSTPPLDRLPKNTQAKITPNMHRREEKKPSTQYASSSFSSVRVERFNSPGGKLKRDKGQLHYSTVRNVGDEPVEAPNLSTQYTLKLAAKPEISFVSVSSNGAPVADCEDSSRYDFSLPQLPKEDEELPARRTSMSDSFIFASPMTLDHGEHSPTSAEVSQIFPNSFPAARSATAAATPPPSVTAPLTQTSGWGDLVKKDIWACNCCLIKNDKNHDVCIACGTRKAVAMTTVTSTSDWGGLIKGSDGKWSCSVCLIKNNKEDLKCVACGTTNASEKPADPVPSTSTTGGWGTMFAQSAVDKWSCESCLLKNDKDKSSCVACGTKNTSASSVPTTTVQPPASSSSGWGDLFKQASEKWGCDACLLKNGSNVTVCVACGTKKPSDSFATAPPTSAPAEPASSGWDDIFKQSEASWGCADCLLQNEKEAAKCAACGANNPNGSAAFLASSTAGASWGNLFSQNLDKWSCDSCFVKNDKELANCQACGTKNPSGDANKPPTTSDVAQTSTSTSSGWGNLFSKPSGQWNCDVCLISNLGDNDCCIACNTKKPSSGPTTAAALPTSKDITGTVAAGWSASSFPAVAPGVGWGSLGVFSTTWKCSTCYIPNQAVTSLCVACGACKPGTQSSLGDLDRGKQIPIYKEGAVTSTSAAPAGGFPSLISIKHPAASSTSTSAASTVGFGALSSIKHPCAGQEAPSTSQPVAAGFTMMPSLKHPALSVDTAAPRASTNLTGGFGSIAAMKHPAVSTNETVTSKLGTSNSAVAGSTLFNLGQQAAASEPQGPKPAGGVPAPAATMLFNFGKSVDKAQAGGPPASSQLVSTSSTAAPFGFGKPTLTYKPQDSTATVSSQSMGAIASSAPTNQPQNAQITFGSQPATNMTSAIQSSFGKPSTDQSNSKLAANQSAGSIATTVGFGQQPTDAEPKETTQSVFQFGSTKPAPASFSQSSTGFGFSSTQSTAGVSQSSSTFQFGSSQPSAPIKPSSVFGTTPATSQPSFQLPKSGFQFSAPTISSIDGSTSDPFGKKRSINADTSDDPAKKKTAPFQFGGGSSGFVNPLSNPGFQFGTQPTDQSQPNVAPFQFGKLTQAAENKNPFQFGTKPIASASATFIFGAPAGNKSGNATSTSSTFQPSNSNSNNNAEPRVVKKAIRRLKKP